MFRNTDVVSSKLAAAEFAASGAREAHQAIILELVTTYPGSTAHELAAHTDQLTHHQVSRRLSEIERAGHIRKGKVRSCTVVRRASVEWWPVSLEDDIREEFGLVRE